MRPTVSTILLGAMLAAATCARAGDELLEQIVPAGAVLLGGECMLITRSGEGENRRYRALATGIPRIACANEFLGPGEVRTDLASAKAAADAEYAKVLAIYQGHGSCAASEIVLDIARGLTAVDAFNLDASRFLGTSVALNLNFDLQSAAEREASRCVPSISFMPGSPLYCLSPSDAANLAEFTRFRVVENAREDVRVSMEYHRGLHEQSMSVSGLSTGAVANLALMGIGELPLVTSPRYAATTLAHLLTDYECRDDILGANPDLRALFTRMLGQRIMSVTPAEVAGVSAALVSRPEDPLPACEYGPGAILGESIGRCPDTYDEF